MHCKPTSAGGHRYIIVAIDYFTKWDEAMPTYAEDGIIATLEHVAVIYLGWLQPRKSFALAISVLLSSKTVMRLLRNAHPVNIFIQKSACTLLHYTPSLSLAILPNGGYISCIVSLPQLGAWLHHISHGLFQ